MAQPNTTIDPSQVKWDAIDPSQVKWDGPTPDQQQQASAPRRFLRGLTDPVDTGAQWLTHILPSGVVDAGNSVNNWIADKTGLVPKIPERNLSSLVTGKSGGLDQLLTDNEKQYQDARTASGNTGIDWWRLGGNVASPANLAIASKIPVGATAGARILAGMGGGAVMGATGTPVTNGGDFATEKGKQALSGLLAGGVTSGLASGVARVINPEVRDNIKRLLAEGITPTPGQILGGRWQSTEDKLTSIPVLGDAISSARSKSLDEFNRAAYNRALEPIGAGTKAPVGRESIIDVKGQLGRAYDNLIPFLTFKADVQFSNELKSLTGMASSMPGPQAAQFQNILQNNVISKLGPKGTMDGEAFKGVTSDLNKIAKGYKSDSLFDNRQLGDAVGELLSSVRGVLKRSNPDYADQLSKIDQGYANYTRLRGGAATQGAPQGKFTPAQLSAAVRAQDQSVGKGRFSEGNALMQDLTDAGKNVLSSQYPDSGSIGRLLMGLGIGGGVASISPVAAGIGAAATLPYLPVGRQLSAALLARRPDAAKPVADAIRKLGPAATPALIPFMQGFNPGQ